MGQRTRTLVTRITGIHTFWAFQRFWAARFCDLEGPEASACGVPRDGVKTTGSAIYEVLTSPPAYIARRSSGGTVWSSRAITLSHEREWVSQRIGGTLAAPNHEGRD
jgi:hypothetical protein